MSKPTIVVTYERATGGVPAQIHGIHRIKQLDCGIAIRHDRPTPHPQRSTRMTTVIPAHRLICIEYHHDEES